MLCVDVCLTACSVRLNCLPHIAQSCPRRLTLLVCICGFKAVSA